jgi:hypothetical protein
MPENILNQDTTNHTQEILERIKSGSTLTGPRGRKIILPEPLPAIAPRSSPLSRPSSFKKGGVVKKTGFAKLHKDEVVLTKKQAAALRTAAKALVLKTKLAKRKKQKPAKKNITKRA